MSELARDDWAGVLEQLDEPPLGDVAEKLADARDLDVLAAYDVVEEAIEDGPLTEVDAGGAFPAVRLDDDRGSDADVEDVSTEADKYRRVYLDAVERAGREPWEPVEESALRDALAAIGFEELLDNGTLFDVRPWRFVDISSDDEEPRRRWYYPSGDEPRTEEFRRFDELLRAAAPDDYEPHYFRVSRASKDPATQYGSWKTEEARLTTEEAVEWMESGGNVGIAGRGGCRECGGDGRVGRETCSECGGSGEDPNHDGPLVNVDIDDDEATTPDDVPTSLRARSRSRTGWHTWYFDEDGDIPNIPTDEYGEVRANWQYVVAPGSFVASCAEDIPDGASDPGYYTVEDEEPVVSIEYDDLPEVFREYAAEVEAVDEAVDSGEEVDDNTPEFTRDDDRSAVFEVEAADLVSATHDDTDRFASIFHGSDTGANMSTSGDKVHCWRHGVAHGGLQALATLSGVDHVRTFGCAELGAAHSNSGAGRNRLKGDWRLVWGAWHEAKRRGVIPDDDPIPYRVLRELAVADDVIAREDLVERDADTGEIVDDESGDTYLALPAGTYNDVLEHVRETYDVEPGRDAVGSGADDAEPVAPLPSGHLDALSPAERKRAVRKRGVDIPSTRDARQRLRDAVFRELRAGNTTVLDAPTAMGKSYGVATEPWRMRDSTTGGAPVVHLHETTDARDDTAEDTLESDATGAVLRGRKEASPLARGDHDPTPDGESDPDIVVTIDGRPASEWFDHQCDDKGLPFSTALALARDRNDQGLDELPPVGQEDPAVAQWDGLPRDEDGEPAVDVIHATHQFAYVPSLRSHTNVVLDEQPDYTVDLAQERIRRMVNAFLREIDAPVSTFGALTTLARSHGSGDAGREADAVDELLSHDTDHGLGTEWFFSDPDAHALAPDLTRALWKALRYSDPDANGRVSEKVWHEPPRFDADEESYNAGTWLSVVVDEQNTIRQVRSTPDFSQARAVIGLDAHPSMSHWQLNGAPGMVRDAVLDPSERRLWRRFERGLTTVQVGDATRPRSGPFAREWMNDDRVRAVIEAIRERHGSGFKTALSTAQTERAVRELLGEVAPGVDDESTMHFGEEKSRNDFADEDAGYVYGCMDPGDEMVLDVIAELGLDATPKRLTEDDVSDGEGHLCDDCGGDGCAECDGTGRKRAKGRAFVGSDADTAASILASVRENHVAQAAGRYARNADDPDDRATVYIHTDATPTGFVDVEAPGVQWLATDLQREILEELSTRASATTREIADVVGCSKEHVRETLQHLEDDDVVSRDAGSGPYGADVYHDDGAESARVDVGDRQQPPNGSSRWSLAIAAPHADGSPLTPASASSSEADDAAMAGDDPPGGEWWRGDHRE